MQGEELAWNVLYAKDVSDLEQLLCAVMECCYPRNLDLLCSLDAVCSFLLVRCKCSCLCCLNSTCTVKVLATNVAVEKLWNNIKFCSKCINIAYFFNNYFK